MSVLHSLPSPDLSDEEPDYVSSCAPSEPGPSTAKIRYERPLGDSELSYFLPSRANGVNDMYLHLGLDAPDRLLHWARVRAVWAILRMRHPLLAARVDMRGYDDVRFVFAPPASPSDALDSADKHLEYTFRTKEDLIEAYLNGPRTLSHDRLSYLIVSRTPTGSQLPTPPQTPLLGQPLSHPPDHATPEPTSSYELFICAAHSIGDGMALHTFANEFFALVGGKLTQAELDALVEAEWRARWAAPAPEGSSPLPASMEERLPDEPGRLRRAVGRVDFQNDARRQIGGQAFPRRADPERHTVVPTVPFDAALTKRMLAKCKAHGVSIASALFAVCNVAWARMSPREKQALPMMMYAAMNVRPALLPPRVDTSYWFLAVGYFNVILPNFLPAACSNEQTFWLRARMAKEQSARAAKSPLLVARNREMAVKRGRQSRAWAREDDARDAGTYVPPPPPPQEKTEEEVERPPSVALLGLSMLGNLDGMYKHAVYPDIQLHTLTTGSRQRHSGMLLFGYTFAGRLWVSLGYDENGFDKKTIDGFWDNVIGAIHEMLV